MRIVGLWVGGLAGMWAFQIKAYLYLYDDQRLRLETKTKAKT